ncbi:MAG: hypothetical protein RRY29_00190 [Desulfovibrionaceae bacterium]
MEHLLIKLARQLDAMDEASLMSLWDQYADTVSHFEPSRRWEEAALVFSLIQAKRWKNQLFNYHWSHQMQPHDGELAPNAFTLEVPPSETEGRTGDGSPQKRCKILSFRPAKSDKPT